MDDTLLELGPGWELIRCQKCGRIFLNQIGGYREPKDFQEWCRVSNMKDQFYAWRLRSEKLERAGKITSAWRERVRAVSFRACVRTGIGTRKHFAVGANGVRSVMAPG